MDGHQRLKRALIMFTLLGLHLVQAQNQQGGYSFSNGYKLIL